jgi:hypothetical protein
MGRYRVARDPYWITAKYPGHCAVCGADVARGDRAFYYPSSKGLLGSHCGCGDKAAADFTAAAMDEAMYSGGYC